ncbi:uncharacterized protein LOC122513164 [Polistes fuscatus]|uniref:uncharacterized protein LOC122513164 n=1 Tax=Polistes fuscatus TaxID=30207 RepID=UPI001CA7EFC3|nr:uncharacterized protein LOC122513164 [Polistes fuscatus]
MTSSMVAMNEGCRVLDKFDPKTMNFFHWLNHFEFTVDFVPIENENKVEFFLGLLNVNTFSDITRKVAPKNPHDIPYEELISHVEELYGLFQGEWAANYRFIYRDQFISESNLNYINALSRIACNVSNFLRNSDSLMVRFIHGLNNENTRRALLSWNDLTLENAVDIAVQLEFIPDWNKKD